MQNIIFKRTYRLNNDYGGIKERALKKLDKYFQYPGLYEFNDVGRRVTFSTERLIPVDDLERPRILLLFSNPHPFSVHQGMFLSPSTRGVENLFWPLMAAAGWLPISQEKRTPNQLVEICSNTTHSGPFSFIFYCYYVFPTDYPEDIRRIFGRTYFKEVIEPEAAAEFKQTILDSDVDVVLTFNKGVFNLVATERVDRYIDRLKEGDLIQSRIESGVKDKPIYLTFPTGWRYDKEFRQLRKTNLVLIRNDIQEKLVPKASKNK